MSDGTEQARRLPVGAEVLPGGGVHFRVWAPRRKKVKVVIEGEGARADDDQQVIELRGEADGYFSGAAERAGDGTLYRFKLDTDDKLYPDPASRFQPRGPHGPSQVIDPTKFKWTDDDRAGVRLAGQVIYEMHVGTFTREGTWGSAMGELEELADLGITVIEVMPVHEFPGRFGWGYDGVDLFAPTRLYGTPDDFRRFVDRAHALGVGVILDVVYNHFGPDGNYLRQFSEDYFTDEHVTDWGDAINFYAENSAPVREFVISNAGYWVDEFHLDGLRLDATQNIYDESPDHVLAALTRRAREAARNRSIILVAENEPQETNLVRPPEQGGFGIDMLWNDDFHHTAMVALTGRREAYYMDYLGRPQEFISAIKYGYLYQGQRYKWQKKRRGTPALDLEPAKFVTFIQNHDQIANTARGERAHQLTSPGRYRAMTALMLLAPATPMLFQGQEFAASAPFLYFADHEPDLARLVSRGRAKFLKQFPSYATPEIQAMLPDPSDPATFERSKLDFRDRERHAGIYAMHRDLLKLRREDKLFSAQRKRSVDGAVLADEAFVLRLFGEDGDDRLLICNFGADLHLDPAPEPLLAPPENMRWQILWSSEDPRYGGNGAPPVEPKGRWRMQGHAAVALAPAFHEERKTLQRAKPRDDKTDEIKNLPGGKKDD
ncbi:MAG TPA: malto-oligosyltrehalose trehalohydrolase [Blastocatellia bacterium]|nr:malto-oligosyltrehalose trehalohydrolase [Blastocatellia bacterium]